MIALTETLADIVIAHPATARVFERHALDYCCHGQRTVASACAASGIEPADLLTELEAAEPEPTTAPDSIGGLIGHIVAEHHTYLRRELPRLGALMDNVVAAHGSAHPEVHALASEFSELSADLLPHLAKEEQILFPLAIQLLGAVDATNLHCGSVVNPITVMHAEHDRAGELLASLRRQSDGYTPPPDACPTWHALYAGLADLESDIHRHVHLENNILFPRITDLESGPRSTGPV